MYWLSADRPGKDKTNGMILAGNFYIKDSPCSVFLPVIICPSADRKLRPR